MNTLQSTPYIKRMLNLTTDDILTGIADTAMKIEANDRKADKIVLPAEIYYNIASQYPSIIDVRATFNGRPSSIYRGRSATYPIIRNDPWTSSQPGRIDYAREVNTTAGLQVMEEDKPRLWGMEVEVSREAKDITVRSEEYGPYFLNNFGYRRDDLLEAARHIALEHGQIQGFATATDITGNPRRSRGKTVPVEYTVDEQQQKVECRQVETISLFQMKLKILRKNTITPIVRHRADPVFAETPAETIALETLREMITEEEFRKYMVQGFVLVRGASGKVYQIFRQQRHIKVRLNGQLVEELCIGLKKELHTPPTDKVIAFKTMIEVGEDVIRKFSNVYNMVGHKSFLGHPVRAVA
jgi:hypothetical protein